MLARGLAALLIILLGLASASGVTQISGTTKLQANLTIARATDYIGLVKNGTYLVFTPNLTQANADLATAQKYYNTSPSTSIVYANMAISDAQSAYNQIGRFRYESFVAMLAFTLALAILLAIVMRPARARRAVRS